MVRGFAVGALVAALLGLFAGAAVWAASQAQAAERPLLAAGNDARWETVLPILVRRALAGRGWMSRPPHDRSVWTRLWFELGVAAYFAVATRNLGASLDLVATLVFALPLLTILLIDWWTRYIHTNVVVAGIVAGLAVAAAHGPTALIGSVLAALGAGAIFGLGYVLAGVLFGDGEEVPFGLGDVYLAAMIGAMAGFPEVVGALFAGVVLAGAVGLVLLLTRRRGRHDAIAYGSFLCLGALLTFLVEGG